MSIMASVQQLNLDLDEVKRLIGLANRPNVKDVLVKEQQRLEKGIAELKLQQASLDSTTEDGTPIVRHSTVQPQLATKVIKSYGWDQSEKFVKVYVTLPEVQSVPASNVSVEFTNNSFVLLVKALKNANHQLARKNLLKDILPEGSHHKVKSDSVVIFLKKAEKENWSYLTQTEQKTKESKSTPKYDEKGDPGDSLMKLMKNMYDEGDDEMKRTIAKAWTESQDKKGMGGMPGMPPMM